MLRDEGLPKENAMTCCIAHLFVQSAVWAVQRLTGLPCARGLREDLLLGEARCKVIHSI